MSFSPLGNSLLDSIPQKTKKQIQIIILEKKRTVLRTWKRKHHKKIYKKYFNGHLWCKFHTHTNTSIPQHYPQNPVYQWKSILNLQYQTILFCYWPSLSIDWTIFVVCSQSPDSRGLNRNLQANHWTDCGEAYLRTKPVEPSEPAGYSGQEMYEIYWKLVMPHRSP